MVQKKDETITSLKARINTDNQGVINGDFKFIFPAIKPSKIAFLAHFFALTSII